MLIPNPVILFLEDCPVTSYLIERVIRRELPDARVLTARTVAEAKALSAGEPISLFLIDVHLPDGSGLAFLEQAASYHSSASAIVITATSVPEHLRTAEALGVLHFIEKPIKIPVLLRLIRAALAARNVASDLSTTLQNVTPLDILQLKCLSVASTVAEFRSNAREGRVRFQKGEVVDAYVGDLRGVEAVREITSWPHGEAFEHGEVGEFERTIHCSWQALLMDAAQAMDERCGETVAA
jgi:CheY-like chemotaxis protein